MDRCAEAERDCLARGADQRSNCCVSRWKPQRKRTLLSTHQAAELLEIHPSSLIKWINDGLITAHRTPGGHRRISVIDLVRFLRAHGMAVPEELLGERRRVLWVDDDPSFNRAVEHAARQVAESVDVMVCDNGIDALVQVGSFKPSVVVIDVFMPGTDGFEVCRRLKANPATRDIVVVMVTGAAEPNHEDMAREAGAAAFLEKPLDVLEVLDLVDQLPAAA